MNEPREDVYCPACPDPDTAFRIEDVGMKFETTGDFQYKATRPVWEPGMIAHLESEDDDEHRRLYDQCMTALNAAGATAEELARRSVESMMGSLRRSMAREAL